MQMKVLHCLQSFLEQGWSLREHGIGEETPPFLVKSYKKSGARYIRCMGETWSTDVFLVKLLPNL